MDSRRRSTRAVDDKNSENTTVSRAFDNTDRNLTVSNEVEKEDVSFFLLFNPVVQLDHVYAIDL
jgi:hypothetical protein|tara:strand:+ start:242 stop:433 length:192 start_codon:yes stop_codon:yes gene_type:complete